MFYKSKHVLRSIPILLLPATERIETVVDALSLLSCIEWRSEDTPSLQVNLMKEEVWRQVTVASTVVARASRPEKCKQDAQPTRLRLPSSNSIGTCMQG